MSKRKIRVRVGHYKRCECAKSSWPDCSHDFWARKMHNGQNFRVNLSTFAGYPVATVTDADIEFAKFVADVTGGKIQPSRKAKHAAQTDAIWHTEAEELRALAFPEAVERYIALRPKLSPDIAYQVRQAALWPALAVLTLEQASTATIAVESFLGSLATRTHIRKPHPHQKPIDHPEPNDAKGRRRQRRRAQRRAIAATKAERTARELAISTRNKYDSALVTMFKFWLRRRVLNATPFEHAGERVFPLLKGETIRTRILEDDEEPRLLALATPRMRDRIVGATDTGMRKGEQQTLRIYDLDAIPGRIRVRASQTKDAEYRVIPILTDRLRDVLARARYDASGRLKGPDEYVYCDGTGHGPIDWDGAWCALRERAGLYHPDPDRSLRWHDFRGTFVSRMLAAGNTPSDVREMTGHATLAMLERYDRNKLKGIEQRAAGRLDGYVRALAPVSTDLAQTADLGLPEPSFEDLVSAGVLAA
jgi:site-specific recombinase XerD